MSQFIKKKYYLLCWKPLSSYLFKQKSRLILYLLILIPKSLGILTLCVRQSNSWQNYTLYFLRLFTLLQHPAWPPWRGKRKFPIPSQSPSFWPRSSVRDSPTMECEVERSAWFTLSFTLSVQLSWSCSSPESLGSATPMPPSCSTGSRWWPTSHPYWGPSLRTLSSVSSLH